MALPDQVTRELFDGFFEADVRLALENIIRRGERSVGTMDCRADLLLSFLERLCGERGGSGQCASSVKGAINHLDRPHQPEGLYGTPLRHSQ